MVVDHKEYDYGVSLGSAPSSAFLLKDTATLYAALGTLTLDHPSVVTVKNGQGVIKAQTTINYDETAVTATQNTPQHVSVGVFRGNATTVTGLVSGSSTVSKHFTYFDTGNVNTGTDTNGAVTTYKYAACGNSFPTEIDLPISGLTSYLTWDTNCAGAVVASHKIAPHRARSFGEGW